MKMILTGWRRRRHRRHRPDPGGVADATRPGPRFLHR